MIKKIINNQHGHGYGISTRDALKVIGVIVTFPISIPLLIIRDKIKEKKEKEKK